MSKIRINTQFWGSGKREYHPYTSVEFSKLPSSCVLLFVCINVIKTFNFHVIDPASIDNKVIADIRKSLATYPDKQCEASIRFEPGVADPTYLKTQINDLVINTKLEVRDLCGREEVFNLP